MLDLRLVRVHDHAPEHVGGRAGAVGQPARHQPARARLGDGHGPHRRPREQPGHDLVDGRPVTGEDPLAEAIHHRRLQSPVVVRRSRLEDRGDLELAAAQAGGDLQRLQRDVRLTEQTRELGLGHTGDPHDALLERARAREHVLQGRRGQRVLPHRLQLAGRTREHDHRRRRREPPARARCRRARAPAHPRGRAPACARPRACPPRWSPGTAPAAARRSPTRALRERDRARAGATRKQRPPRR